MSTHLLRAYRDLMVPDAQCTLANARPRIAYVRSGALTVRAAGQVAALAPNSAWHGAGSVLLRAGKGGAEVLRWELVPKGAAAAGEPLLESPVTLADGAWLMRCDRVDFPPGGIAYTHTHRGPGIRILLEGAIAVRVAGAEHRMQPGEAWFEAGPDPVLALASEAAPTSFVRVMILPADLRGASSIRYVLPEDQDKPKRQSYQVFVDEPIAT